MDIKWKVFRLSPSLQEFSEFDIKGLSYEEGNYTLDHSYTADSEKEAVKFISQYASRDEWVVLKVYCK